MFNKTKLGLAVVLLAGSAAVSATTAVTGTPVVYTPEGADGVTTTTVDSFEITLAQTYVELDVITLKFTADFDADETFSGANVTCDAANADADDSIILNYFGKTEVAGEIKYRFTQIEDLTAPDGITTVGATCEFDNGTNDYDMAGTAVSVSWSSDLETGASAVLSSVLEDNQFAINIGAGANDSFDETVDVGDDRKTFEDGDTSDTATVQVTETTAVAYTDATYGVTSTITLNGDFSYMFDGDDAQIDDYDVTVALGGADKPTTVTKTGVTWTADAIGDYVITLSVPAAEDDRTQEILVNEPFTIDANIVYTNTVLGQGDVAAGSAALAITNAGSHDLNATSVTVYSVPFSAGVIQLIWVSNGSAIAGDVSATFTHDGSTSSSYTLGSVAGNTNMRVDDLLKTAAGDDYPTDGRGDITVTVTSNDTKVLGSYYKDGDRLLLESSDTLNSEIPE